MEKKEVIEWLDETAFYIEQVVGKNSLEEHHHKMFKAINKAIELLNKCNHEKK